MRFTYTKIPTTDPRRKWISRPIITVLLLGPKGSVIVDALLDSGADKCLFHSDIAKEIGLPLEEGETEMFSGIAVKQLVASCHRIHLQVVGIDKKVEIAAGFVSSPGVFAILGQEGFFDSFRVKFEKDHDTIEIIPVQKKK